MKKVLKNAVQGMALGVVLGLVISLMFNYGYGTAQYYPSSPQFMAHFTHPLNAVLVSLILWATIGVVFSLGALIFKIKNWSLLKCTIVNFWIYYLGFTPLAMLAGWVPMTLKSLSTFTITFLLIYLLMWLINVVRDRHQIAKINERIKRG